jgi:hypothetical protein
MDNNVTASPRFREIIAEIRDLGFTPGAKLKRAYEDSRATHRLDKINAELQDVQVHLLFACNDTLRGHPGPRVATAGFSASW